MELEDVLTMDLVLELLMDMGTEVLAVGEEVEVTTTPHTLTTVMEFVTADMVLHTKMQDGVGTEEPTSQSSPQLFKILQLEPSLLLLSL